MNRDAVLAAGLGGASAVVLLMAAARPPASGLAASQPDHTAASQTQLVANGGTPGYPPPVPVQPTSTVPSPGVYGGLSAMEIATAMIPDFEDWGWAIAPTSVIAAVDMYAGDGGGPGIPPEEISYGGEPDAAFILQGNLRPPLVPSFEPDERLPYMLVVVDRASGIPYAFATDIELERLLQKLP